MQDLPAGEVSHQFTGNHSCFRWLLVPFGRVNDNDERAAGPQAKFRGLYQIPLQVVANENCVPSFGLDYVLAALHIGHYSPKGDAELSATLLENRDGGRSAIDSRYAPAKPGEPDCIPSCTRGYVKRGPGPESIQEALDQRCWPRHRVAWRRRFRSIALLPTSDFHPLFLLGEEGRGLNARYVECLPAPWIFAGSLIIEQNHIACRLGEFSPIAFVCLTRQSVHLATDEPTQIVRFRTAAKRAIQRDRFSGLRLSIKGAFIHGS